MSTPSPVLPLAAQRVVDVRLTPAAEARGELLLIGCFEGEAPDASRLPPAAHEAAAKLAGRGGWKGGVGQVAEAETGLDDVPRVALRGLGKRDSLHVRRLEKWLREAADHASVHGIAHLLLALPDHALTRGPEAAGRIARQVATARYRFDRFRKKADEPDPLSRVDVVVGEVDEALGHELAAAMAAARGMAAARDLANTPPNVATPEWIGERAEELARELGLEVEVLAREDLELKGMGGVLAVGGGSLNPPRLVRLTWHGAETPRVVLVGKGVTFDTGGISIKPAKDMDEMKWDKCGACTVLGVIQAAARLKLPVHLSVYTPLAENMPDGASYRPGDILTCYNGKTVEVLNTDAEGRIILADAIAWAAESDPNYLIEYSTLTGACVVALGSTGGGLYTPSDELAAALLGAAESAGERLWRMPLWPEFREALEGTHADLKNVAGRWGGANTAAAFLSHFVGDVQQWAHLDIAGPAYIGEGGDAPRGATGYGVALTLRWLRSLVDA
jgi:leucyl aminopeptidase